MNYAEHIIDTHVYAVNGFSSPYQERVHCFIFGSYGRLSESSVSGEHPHMVVVSYINKNISRPIGVWVVHITLDELYIKTSVFDKLPLSHCLICHGLIGNLYLWVVWCIFCFFKSPRYSGRKRKVDLHIFSLPSVWQADSAHVTGFYVMHYWYWAD